MAAAEAVWEGRTLERTGARLPAAFADPWTADVWTIRMRQSAALVLGAVEAARPAAASESPEEVSMTRVSMTRESPTGEPTADQQDQETEAAPAVRPRTAVALAAVALAAMAVLPESKIVPKTSTAPAASIPP
jgi:hypothetical protein